MNTLQQLTTAGLHFTPELIETIKAKRVFSGHLLTREMGDDLLQVGSREDDPYPSTSFIPKRYHVAQGFVKQ